jgi:hypothetical protein
MIYKDHGIVDYIDGEPYYNVISVTLPKNGEKLNLGERLRKRFNI